MASINIKKGSPYWWAWFRYACGKQDSKSTGILREPPDPALQAANRLAAQQVADAIEHRAKQGLPVGRPAGKTASPLRLGIPTFHEYTRGWIDRIGGDKKYHAKVHRYFDNIDRFLGTKVSWLMCQLHRPDVIGLAPHLLSLGYSPTTVTLHLRVLRQAFLGAQAAGLVLASPVSLEDFLTNHCPVGPRAFNPPQVECLINSTSTIDWRTATLFGFYFGMDLIPAVSRLWDQINLAGKKVSWVSFTRTGKPIEMVMPMHPLVERHLIALKKVAISEYVTPSLHDLSDSVLRAHFQKIVQRSGVPFCSVTSGLGRSYSDLQFGSLKLSFAHEMGHTGLFRLSRFLRSMSFQDLAMKIEKLPSLDLRPLPLLA